MENARASNWSKFYLLLWKNALLEVRHPIKLVIEILTPAICCGLIVVLAKTLLESGVESKDTPTHFNPLKVDTLDVVRPFINQTSYGSLKATNFKLIYSPKTQILHDIVEAAAKDIGVTEAVGYDDPNELVGHILLHEYFAGIVFSEKDNYDTALPQHVKYALRFPGALRASNQGKKLLGELVDWDCDRATPLDTYVTTLPRNPNASSGGGPPCYYCEGFLAVQHALANQILRWHSHNRTGMPANTYIQRFSYPPYRSNQMPKLRLLFAIAPIASMLVTLLAMIETIATEREQKLTEAMRIMGMPEWMNYCGYMVHNSVSAVIIVAIQTSILYGAGLLVFTPVPTFLLLIFSFSMWMLCFGLLMSTVNKSPIVCVFVAEMVVVELFLITVKVLFTHRGKWTHGVLLTYAGLLGMPGVMIGMFVLLEIEGRGETNVLMLFGEGLQVNVAEMVAMTVVNGLLCVLVALYVDKVRPGEYGVARVWYFPVTRAFWCGARPVTTTTTSTNTTSNDADLATAATHSFENIEAGNLAAGISMRGLYKKYKDGFVALRPFDMDVYENEITVLIGHNGSGKTTLLSILTGMCEPTAGTALVNGFDIRRQLSSARGSIGLCPQHDILFEDLTVAEHLRFYCGLKGLKRDARKAEVERYLDLVHMQTKRDKRASELSGGHHRALSVCIAFCGGSRVVICDEPSANMDPVARSHLWHMFEQEKRGRTVLLTTHIMDEVDVLGDRIAILHKGVLRALGSPFYLKKHFGVGYWLNCVVDERTANRPMLWQLLKTHLQDVRLERDLETELIYHLPDDRVEHFADLLELLEEYRDVLGLHHYGITVGSVAEVYQKISTDPMLAPTYTARFPPELRFQFLRGFKLLRSQFVAMWHKKWTTSKRMCIITFAQIVTPALQALYSTLTTASMNSNDAKARLTLNNNMVSSLHKKTESLLQYTANATADSIVRLFEYAYVAVVEASGIAKVVGSNDIRYEMIHSDFHDIHFHRQFGAHMPDDQTVVAWFNNRALHSAPLSLANVHNALMRAHLGDAYQITVDNWPLPIVHDPLRFDPMSQLGVQWVQSMSISMPSTITLYLIAVVKERVNGATRLQFASGANVFVYWAATFAFDMAVFSLSALLMFVCLVGFREPGFKTGEDFGIFMLVMLTFAASALPLTYLLARLFSQAAKALLWLSGLYMLTSLFAFTTATMFIGLWEPNFSLIASLNNAIRKAKQRVSCEQFCDQLPHCRNVEHSMCSLLPVCCTLSPWQFNLESVLLPMVCMSVTGALCSVLNALIDRGAFVGCWDPCRRQAKARAEVEAPSAEPMEEDVAAEDRLIEVMTKKRIAAHALVARKLRKRYKKHVVVDRLSMAVKSSECFGLLGVTGSGKTTTFRMLTGVLRMDAGDAWVEGHSVRGDQAQARRLIGYAPQRNALIMELTGRQTLHLYGRLRGVPPEIIATLTERLAAKLYCQDHLDKQIRRCSSGIRRKFAAAVAVIGRPRLVLMDEPTTGMDMEARQSLGIHIQRLLTTGTAVVLTLHAMDECEELCTRLAVLVNGQFQCIGTVQHLKDRYGSYCTLVVNLAMDRLEGQERVDEEVQRITTFVESVFEGAKLRKRFLSLLTFTIPKDDDVQWSSMFRIMHDAKELLAIENFTLSQTTLEDVFLYFAERQQYEDDDRHSQDA